MRSASAGPVKEGRYGGHLLCDGVYMVHDAITCLQLLVQEHRRCNAQPEGLEIQPDMVGLVKHSTRQKVPFARKSESFK